MPESRLLAMVLIAAALLFPAALNGGNISPLDQTAMAALMTKRKAPSEVGSLAKRGTPSRFGLSRPELLRLLAAMGAEPREPSQPRFVQLILIMALASEGLPLLLRR